MTDTISFADDDPVYPATVCEGGSKALPMSGVLKAQSCLMP